MFATASFFRTVVGTVGAALFAATCLVAAVTPAQAAVAAEAVSQTVRYDDLNLSSAAGRAALELRIRAAAKAVCTVGGNDLKTRTSEARCTKNAIAAAIQS